MPEGDTVWAAAKRLDDALAGTELTRTDFRVPRYATLDLTGRTVSEVLARGKHLLIRVAGDAVAGDAEAGGAEAGRAETAAAEAVGAVTIHSHLKMEGIWHVYAPGAKWRKPAHTARIVLGTATATAVGFSLGTLQVLPRGGEDQAVGHLGPDLLGPDWDPDEALGRLRANPARAVGLAVLDQRNLAGIGNIYRNEVCFLAGVHPGAAVAEVTNLERLVDVAQRLLQVNSARRVRTTTGFASMTAAGGLWVYRRDRQPCRRCGTLIVAGVLGDPSDASRNIYFCPFCQPPSSGGVLDT